MVKWHVVVLTKAALHVIYAAGLFSVVLTSDYEEGFGNALVNVKNTLSSSKEQLSFIGQRNK